jgi:hypothetical protein
MHFDNRDDFRVLGGLLKNIRTLHSTDPAVLSQRLLYLIRPHPVFADQYKFISSNNIFLAFIKAVSLFTTFFIYAFISCFSRFTTLTAKGIDHRASSLFISHHVNEQVLRDDFYFNTWTDFFLNRGESVDFLYFEASPRNKFPDVRPNLKIRSSFVPLSLGFFDEIKIFRLLFLASLKFFRSFVYSKNKLEKIIYLELFSQTFSKSSLINLRFYFVSLNKLQASNYKRVFFTFEGHAWETMLILAAQKTDKKLKTFGYQHSGVFKDQISLLDPISSIIPSGILTSGEGNNIFFMEYQKHGADIFSIGTSRTHEIKALTNQAEHVCLLVPEGIDSEIDLMCNFVFECDALKNKISFIIQLHPASKNSKIVKNLIKKIQKTNDHINISISNMPLEESINHAQYVLYRGSTAVVKCIMSGLIPLYLDTNRSDNIDPIYWIKKMHINSPVSLEMIVLNTPFASHQNNLKTIQAKCSHYFQPLNLDTLNKL